MMNAERLTLRTPFGMALGLSAGFFALVAWEQSYFWRLREDYSFGWLVPLLAVYVVYDRWPRIEAAWAACGRRGGLELAGWSKRVTQGIAFTALGVGGVGVLLACFHRAAIGPSQPGAMLITLGSVAVVGALLYLTAPGGDADVARAFWEDGRFRLAGLFFFPCAVWLISAPLVTAIERPINLFLLRQITTAVCALFGVLGMPIEQQGNVLVLPLGKVGVQEACSGIRSLTGSLFAGSFLAAVLLGRWWSKTALVVAALVLALIINLIRTIALTLWAYRNGPQSIEGTVHDVVGYVELGMTVAGLLGMVYFLRRLFAGMAQEI